MYQGQLYLGHGRWRCGALQFEVPARVLYCVVLLPAGWYVCMRVRPSQAGRHAKALGSSTSCLSGF
jgi:hypothetical protein